MHTFVWETVSGGGVEAKGSGAFGEVKGNAFSWKQK